MEVDALLLTQLLQMGKVMKRANIYHDLFCKHFEMSQRYENICKQPNCPNPQ